jgi:hypothetical protein
MAALATGKFPMAECVTAGLALVGGGVLVRVPLDHTVLTLYLLWVATLVYRTITGLSRFVAWRHHKPIRVQARVFRPDRLRLGAGFAWAPKHATALRQYRRETGELPLVDAFTPALHAVGASLSRPIHLPAAVLGDHIAIQGMTGSGKSVALTSVAVQAVLANRGPVVAIEPKGDPYTLSQILSAAHATGRKLYLFSPLVPEMSAAINPLSTAQDPEEIIARLRPIFDQARDPFFINTPLRAILLAARLQQRVGDPWRLDALYRDVMDPDARAQLVARYLSALAIPHASQITVEGVRDAYRASGMDDELARDAIRWLGIREEYRMETMSNLDTAVVGLLGARWSHLFHGGMSWDDMDHENAVLLVLTHSMQLRDISHKIARLMLQDLMGYLARRQGTSRAARVPLTVCIDEVAQVAYPDFLTHVALCRAAGARLVMAWQSMAGLRHTLGDDGAQELLDNIGTVLTMRAANIQNAKDIAEQFTTYQMRMVQAGASQSYQSGKQTTATRRVVHQEVALIDPNWLLKLPTGHGFLARAGTPYKIQVPMLPPADRTAIEFVGYGDLMTLFEEEETDDETPVG